MNLKKLHPQPLRVVVRDCFWWIVLGGALALLLLIVDDGEIPRILDFELLVLKKKALLAAVLAVLAIRLTYGLLFRRTYEYRIERGRLQIVRGVILKEEALVPLMPMTELYISRGWIDLLFGLSNVYVAVILERAQKIGEIRGLRHADAVKVRDAILSAMEAQQILPAPAYAPSTESFVVLDRLEFAAQKFPFIEN